MASSSAGAAGGKAPQQQPPPPPAVLSEDRVPWEEKLGACMYMHVYLCLGAVCLINAPTPLTSDHLIDRSTTPPTQTQAT